MSSLKEEDKEKSTHVNQLETPFLGKTIILSKSVNPNGGTIGKSGDSIIHVYNDELYSSRDNGLVAGILGYCRVSTIDQAREGISLETQEEKIKEYAKQRGVPIKAIYRDEGISGGNLLARPAMKQLILDVKARDYVVVLSISRLSRNLADGLEMEQKIRNKKAHLVVLDMGIDTNTAVGRMIFQVMGATAEHERSATIERVSMNMGYLASIGKLRSKPQYGWKCGDNKIDFIQIPEEQAVIEKIRKLRHDHPTLTAAAIARILDDDKAPLRRAKRWYPSAVSRIMERNEIH
jgi:site-specific DNA recombinase